jgi:hypothetical protein
MTAGIEKLNQLMEVRRLPYIMVDDEGAIEI